MVSNRGVWYRLEIDNRNEQYEKAKNIAFGYLTKRWASEKKLRDKLRQRGVESDEAIDKAVLLMKDAVQISDFLF